MTRSIVLLEQRINHRIYDIAKELFGLPDGNGIDSFLHSLPCPLPGCGSSEFQFNPGSRSFMCFECEFLGSIVRLTERVFDKSFAEAFDIVAEAAECQDLIPEKLPPGVSHISEIIPEVLAMIQTQTEGNDGT